MENQSYKENVRLVSWEEEIEKKKMQEDKANSLCGSLLTWVSQSK